MPIAFTVRLATKDDLDDILRLNQALFDYEYAEGFTQTYNREWTYSEDGKGYFTKFVQKDDHKGWVALNDEGVAVGYLIGFVDNLAFRSPQRVSEIEMVYVDEGFRCSGIGKELVDEFKKWSEEQGAGILRVGAMSPNKHARTFYAKWGFVESEIYFEMPC